MTQQDSLRYAEAVQEYETHKRHFYIFPHDDISPIRAIKELFSDKTALLFGIGGYIVISFVFALIGWIFTKSFLTSLVASAVILLVFYVFIGISEYFLALNYVDGFAHDSITGEIILFFIVLAAYNYVKKATYNTTYGVIAGIIVFFIGIWIAKAVFFDGDNKKPSIDDFDSDLIEERRIRDLKKRIVDNWDDVKALMPEDYYTAVLRQSTSQICIGMLCVVLQDETSFILATDDKVREGMAGILRQYAGEDVEFKFAYTEGDMIHWEE